MNERIRELVVQSGGNFANGSLEFAVVFGELKDLEKFAELIVRECMDVVSKKCASPTAYNALTEHFGVEE